MRGCEGNEEEGNWAAVDGLVRRTHLWKGAHGFELSELRIHRGESVMTRRLHVSHGHKARGRLHERLCEVEG